MQPVAINTQGHITRNMRNTCICFMMLMFITSTMSVPEGSLVGKHEVTTTRGEIRPCPRGWIHLAGFCLRQRRTSEQDCQADGARYIAGICIKRSRKEKTEDSFDKSISSEVRDTRFCCIGGYGK